KIRGHKAEEQSGEKRSRGREREDSAVKRDRMQVQQVLGADAEQGVGATEGECSAETAADQSKHNAFRQQLASDAPSAGSERGADGDFAFPSCRSGKQQAGNIGA